MINLSVCSSLAQLKLANCMTRYSNIGNLGVFKKTSVQSNLTNCRIAAARHLHIRYIHYMFPFKSALSAGGGVRPRPTTSFFDLHECPSHLTTSRSVHQFLHSSSACRTHRHTNRATCDMCVRAMRPNKLSNSIYISPSANAHYLYYVLVIIRDINWI